MSTARQLLEEIEHIEARLADPSSSLTAQQQTLLMMSRVALTGELNRLETDARGETESEALRRLAHDNGGGLLGTFDSAHENPLQATKEEILQSVLDHHGAAAMANVEAAMLEAEMPADVPEWQRQAQEAANG